MSHLVLDIFEKIYIDVYNRGGQTAACEPHAALWDFRKITYLFFIFYCYCKM